MNVTRAAVLIGAFSIFSKILGAVRQAVFANRFGAGTEVDIYVAAFRVPDLVFNLLILGTLGAAFIPVFVQYLARDREEALKIASTVFNLVLAAMSVLGVVGFLLAPYFVPLIVPGFDAESKDLTLTMTRIMMLSPLFFSLSSVATSILHSHKRFLLASIAPLFYNLSIIFGIVFFYPRFGLAGIAWGVVLGAGIHFLIQLPSTFRLGFRPFKYLETDHKAVRKIGKLFLPRILGIDLGQISLLIASVIGSTLGAGSLAIFYFAYDLESVPLGIFAISFAIASFPVMADYWSKHDLAGFKKFFAETSVQVLFFIIPISVMILLLRAQIVRLILGAGQNTSFTFADTRLTAQALGFFALSLFAQSLIPLVARAFYAMQNTIIPVISGLVAASVNIILAVILVRFAGADIMALAFSIASFVNLFILFAILHKKLRGLEDEYLFLRTVKISIASIIMGVAVYATLYAVAPLVNMQTYLGILIQASSALVIGGLAYLGAGLAVRLEETKKLLSITRNWFFKFTRPLTSAVINMFTDLG